MFGSPKGDHEECILISDIVADSKYYDDFRLSDSFVSYILANVICSRCLDTIDNPTHLDSCDQPSRSDASWSSPRNRCCYIEAANFVEFRNLWEREKRRWREFSRKHKLGKIPLPPEGVLNVLKDKQNNRCFYCFNEFDNSSKRYKAHLDHYVSVTNGGNNSIFNLVYACAWCNQQKFTENGDMFIEKFFKLSHDDVNRNTHRMRDKVGLWKEQFRPELLSEVERIKERHLRGMPDTKSEQFAKWLDEEYRLLLRIECINGELAKIKPKPSER